MKINEHGAREPLDRPGEAPGVVPEAGRDRRRPDVAGPPGDRVSVSEDARTLARLRGELGDLAAVRTEKVEALRGQIERGEYRVDFRAVARRLLEAVFGERGGDSGG
jgi:negative regulator of flagellin synthesis FlgM